MANEDFMSIQADDMGRGYETAIVPVPMDVDGAVQTYQAMNRFISRVMRAKIDYGEVPGTGGKPSLFKAGAEKLLRFFHFSAPMREVSSVEQWEVPVTASTFPVFAYRYVIEVFGSDGRLINSCEGECNSYESKYRWRWLPPVELPPKYKAAYEAGELETQAGGEEIFAFALEKKETTGKYARPKEYWDSWEADVESGKATSFKKKTRSGEMKDAWKRDSTVVRIPNDDIYSQINTIMKMAQKRTLVGGILVAANASEYFTQDIEDFTGQLDENKAIRTFVPDADTAKHRLVDYVASLGITNPGIWIKELLDQNQIVFQLEDWLNILELIDANIPE